MQLTIPKTERERLAVREIPVSQFISLSHLNAPHIFETKNGAQGAVISVKGCSFEVMDESDLNWHQRMMANLLLSLSDEFAVYVTLHRRKQNTYPDGDFESGLARKFDMAYRKKFEKKSLYVNDLYVTLMIKGSSRKLMKGVGFLRQLSHQFMKSALNEYREKQRKKLDKAIANAMQALADFSPRILGKENVEEGSIKSPENMEVLGKESELLSFFSIIINADKRSFNYSKQALDTCLPTKRIFYGRRTVEWQGNTASDRMLGAVLAVKQYGAHSAPPALDALLRVDFEFISTHIFLRKEESAVMDKINIQLKHLTDADDEAISEQVALEAAKDMLASKQITFGEHQNTLVVLGESIEKLDHAISVVEKIYRDVNIVLVRESLNIENAFWSQLPGNFSCIRRGSLISSDNFADFCALHNYHSGYINKNHLGSAVTVFETSSSTPFYFNFHESGSGRKNDKTAGHTVMFAPTGGGKTTLVCGLDAQFKKYGGASIFFDRDRGCEIYVRAMRGFYTEIHPKHPTGFNPLQLEDTPGNRSFLSRWLASLLCEPNEILPANIQKQVDDAIDRNYTLPKEHRMLSIIYSFLPSGFKRSEQLSPWLGELPGQKKGRLAYLFDNEIDELDMGHGMMGFDMTYLLDHEPPQVIFSVMLYLFYRIESMIDQRKEDKPIAIYLDEAWKLLNDAYWKEKIKTYLATFRKKNTFLMFITQLVSTVSESELKASLIENTPTKIFMPNKDARKEEYMDIFGLSHREFHFIKTTNPKERRFLIKQGREAAIARFDLSGLEQFIAIFSANKETVCLLDGLRSELGDDPDIWLSVFEQRVMANENC